MPMSSTTIRSLRQIRATVRATAFDLVMVVARDSRVNQATFMYVGQPPGRALTEVQECFFRRRPWPGPGLPRPVAGRVMQIVVVADPRAARRGQLMAGDLGQPATPRPGMLCVRLPDTKSVASLWILFGKIGRSATVVPSAPINGAAGGAVGRPGGGGVVMTGGEAQITDLAVDDHACLTYGEPEELLDLTAAFVRDGLAAALKVVLLSDTEPADRVAELERRGIAVESATADGQLAAVPDSRLLSDRTFTAARAMDWLQAEMSAIGSGGYPGLRVAIDMGWALRPVRGVEQLPDFEEGIAAALTGTRVSVLCQYDRDRFDPVTLASVAAFHTRSVAAATYYADAILRICRQYAPPGIRLAGELDYKAEEPLSLALAEAIRYDGDLTVNMSALSFIDASCIRLIIEAARSLASARRVILQCPRWIEGRFILYGALQVPGIKLVRTHDR
jgi:hypothetical protein